MFRAGIFLCNERFCRRDKIVEYVLFTFFGTSLVPIFAILATAAQIWLSQDASFFHPGKVRIGITRLQGDIESAVPGQQNGVGNIQLSPFMVHDKHWHLSTVFRTVKNLLVFVIERRYWHRRFAKDLVLSRTHIVTVNSGRKDKRIEGVKQLWPILSSGERIN